MLTGNAQRAASDSASPATAGKAGGRVDKFLHLVLLALVALMWLPRTRGPIDLRWDGGVYYILGTSLAEGKGYKLLSEPGEIDATQYPPLFPAVIAAHQMVLGTSDPLVVGRWLRLTFFLVFLLFIHATFLLLRTCFSAKYAFFATLLCLFNLHLYFMSDLCFPETLFGLTTVLCVILNSDARKRVRPVLAAVFAIASYAIRTIGFALLAAWIIESLLQKKYRSMALRAAVAALPVLCWQSYIHAVESSPEYRNPAYTYQRADYMFYNVSYTRNISLRDPFIPEKGYLTWYTALRRFGHNLIRLPVSAGEAVSIKRDYWELRWLPFKRSTSAARAIEWVVLMILALLGCAVFAGLVLLLIRRQWLVPVYVSIYLAGICMTPWPQQFTRYLAPLAPFLVMALFTCLVSLKDAARWVPTRANKIASASIMIGVLALIIAQQLAGLFEVYIAEHQRVSYDQNGRTVSYRLFFYTDSYKALDEALDWLKGQARPGEVAAASMPHWVYLRTGLKAVMPPFEADPAVEQDLIDSVPVAYLIVDEGALDTRSYLLPMLRRFPDRWQHVFAGAQGKTHIYRRVNPQPE
jgi:hypothetical protein